jgi:hypothetical protein
MESMDILQLSENKPLQRLKRFIYAHQMDASINNYYRK